MNAQYEKATFAAGCFWGVEYRFRRIPGVVATRVGYSGGHTPNPTYQHVCTGTTGHAEAVEVEFDPTRISYTELLHHFWQMHDPTTRDRQGPDIGSQYRSVIFFHNEKQQQLAKNIKASLEQSGTYLAPIVTEIIPAAPFYPAEDYHQCYLEKKGLPGCHT